MKGDTPQNEIDKEELGLIVRRLRLEAGLTQEEFAEKLSRQSGRNYTVKMISLYENGKDHMNACVLFDIAEFFNISLDVLAPSRIKDGNANND